MTQTLRPYQSAALDAMRASLCHHKSVLLVSPTGSGKTTIAAEMIRSAVGKGNRVVFLAHRKELIDQCSTRLDQFAIPHGVIMAGHPRRKPSLPVQVASVQTLVRREKPPAGLVVVDEAHHARAGTYAKILDAYQAPVVGLSATPWRSDGKGLGELFQDLVVAATPRELIDQGYLVPARGWAFDAPELSGVAMKGRDYDPTALELVMGGKALAGNIVDSYREHALGKRAVLFAVSVRHSKDLCARFVAAGIPAEHVDGETPKLEREAILARFAAGVTLVLCNVGVLTEGWDCPAAEVCILARPTMSLGLYLQMVGRILRPSAGKEYALIHDHAGNVMRHGRPEEDRDYALGSDVKKSKASLPPMRTCEDCYAIYPASAATCPECGHRNEARVYSEPREVRATRAIPLDHVQRAPEAERRDYYRFLRRSCEMAGYKPGWAAHQYKARYGEWPPWSWTRSAA